MLSAAELPVEIFLLCFCWAVPIGRCVSALLYLWRLKCCRRNSRCGFASPRYEMVVLACVDFVHAKRVQSNFLGMCAVVERQAAV